MFVTFEGPEGAGKSTVMAMVADALERSGKEIVVTREPGGSPIGPKIRAILLEGTEVSAWAEVMLFLADRTEHVRSVIRPALESGHIVLCDRFNDSTIVYQGHARGLQLGILREMCGIATQDLIPDLTLLLDLDPKIGLERQSKRDRLDSEPLAFHQKVRDGFLREAQREPGRWQIIDASQPIDDVVAACLEAISARLTTN